MTDYDGTLRNIYQDFAAFGATRGASMPMMDGPKFAKFAKDCKLLDKTNLTATDVDLIFAKAKSKTERRITYDQFYTAVCMMADKRYPDQTGENAFEAIMKKIITSHGPSAGSATVADSSGIYGKLTDTNLYTGSHKERFNTDGSGKGLEGRDKINKGTGSNRGIAPANLQFNAEESPPVSDDEESNEALAHQVAQLGDKLEDVSQLEGQGSTTPTFAKNKTRTYLHTPHPKDNTPPSNISTPSPKHSPNDPVTPNYLTPTKSATAKLTPKYTPSSSTPRFNTSVKFASPSVAKSNSSLTPGKSLQSSTSSKSPGKSPSTSPMTKVNSAPLSKSASKPNPSKPSIFDKLTDSSQYTGSHKNRFNSDGSGRGMAGRDSVRKGGVSGQDLSQMVRRS